MAKNYQEIAVAYVATCQAATLVQQFAHQGAAKNREDMATLMKSLLIIQPESTLSIYGDNLAHLKMGIETALAQLGSGQGKLDTEIGRYWIGLLSLSQKLNKSSEAKATLVQRLQQIERQLPLYENDIMADQMIANLAAIYSDVISPLGTKIHVLGMQDYLVRPDIQQKIRATLLAGIRAGILWQQVGGTRWQFLFSRKKLLNQVKDLYKML